MHVRWLEQVGILLVQVLGVSAEVQESVSPLCAVCFECLAQLGARQTLCIVSPNEQDVLDGLLVEPKGGSGVPLLSNSRVSGPGCDADDVQRIGLEARYVADNPFFVGRVAQSACPQAIGVFDDRGQFHELGVGPEKAFTLSVFHRFKLQVRREGPEDLRTEVRARVFVGTLRQAYKFLLRNQKSLLRLRELLFKILLIHCIG